MSPPRNSFVEGWPRCAIYTRAVGAPTLEQERRALTRQRAVCAAFIATHLGWRLLPTRYDDGGCAGNPVDRPALARLLADLNAGALEVVVATTIDRLGTSLLDAVRWIERFESAGAVFRTAAPVVIRVEPPAHGRRRGSMRFPFEENL